MRNSILLLALTPFALQASTIQFSLTNFNLTTPSNVIQVIPMDGPVRSGNTLITGLPIRLQPSNGYIATNLLAGRYELRIQGITFPTAKYFYVPSDSETYSIATLLTNAATVTASPPMVATVTNTDGSLAVTPTTGAGNVTMRVNRLALTTVTNANNLTNWATLPTNILATAGQTNWALTSITNANNLTNWATLDTNQIATANTITQTVNAIAVTRDAGAPAILIPNLSGTGTNTIITSDTETNFTTVFPLGNIRDGKTNSLFVLMDSIGEGAGFYPNFITWATNLYLTGQYWAFITNASVVGEPVTHMNERYPTEIRPMVQASVARGEYPIVLIGTLLNDIVTNDYNALVGIASNGWANAHADGADVVACTIPPTSSNWSNAAVVEACLKVNELIRTHPDPDYLIDLAKMFSSTNLDRADGIHFTTNANRLIALELARQLSLPKRKAGPAPQYHDTTWFRDLQVSNLWVNGPTVFGSAVSVPSLTFSDAIGGPLGFNPTPGLYLDAVGKQFLARFQQGYIMMDAAHTENSTNGLWFGSGDGTYLSANMTTLAHLALNGNFDIAGAFIGLNTSLTNASGQTIAEEIAAGGGGSSTNYATLSGTNSFSGTNNFEQAITAPYLTFNDAIGGPLGFSPFPGLFLDYPTKALIERFQQGYMMMDASHSENSTNGIWWGKGDGTYLAENMTTLAHLDMSGNLSVSGTLTATNGVNLLSPDGTPYKLGIDNSGSITNPVASAVTNTGPLVVGQVTGAATAQSVLDATNNMVKAALSASNATNLYNANLPVPTNAPAAGTRVVATSASTAAWIYGFITNQNNIKPDFNQRYSELTTNAAFAFGNCANVSATTYQPCVVLVTNSTAAAVAVTAPTGVKTSGTWYVTNATVFSFFNWAGRMTNAIALPIF